jgi:hypothetical protein
LCLGTALLHIAYFKHFNCSFFKDYNWKYCVVSLKTAAVITVNKMAGLGMVLNRSNVYLFGRGISLVVFA